MEKGARPLVLTYDAGAIQPNTTALAAAQMDEIAQRPSDRKHGIFTYYLLKGLDEGSTFASSFGRSGSGAGFARPPAVPAARTRAARRTAPARFAQLQVRKAHPHTRFPYFR